MKKYRVVLEAQGDILIEAESEEDAVEKALEYPVSAFHPDYEYTAEEVE